MKKISVYSTPSCPYCVMVKEYLTEKGFDFEDYDVSINLEKRQEMMDLTGGQMGVPVIAIDKDVVLGFDRARIDMLLDIS